MEQLTIKRYSDLKCEFVFPQLVRRLRKLFERCFRGDVKYTYLYSGKLKNDSNNASLLSVYYRHDLKGCGASVIGLRNSRPI